MDLKNLKVGQTVNVKADYAEKVDYMKDAGIAAPKSEKEYDKLVKHEVQEIQKVLADILRSKFKFIECNEITKEDHELKYTLSFIEKYA